jgi:uncharacterized protein (TIGR04168 family)
LKLAIIGDVHSCWVEADNDFFNASDYDTVLFVGDLPSFVGSLPTARRISGLHKTAFLIPGNHDATSALQFAAELKQKKRLAALLGAGHAVREAQLRAALGGVKLVAYSVETISFDGKPLGIVAGRPYSMGGDRIYFERHLRQQYGVKSFGDSVAKFRTLIDATPRDILFLSHNGPAGLGNARDDIWGCDFSRNGGDFGDPDLRDAIAYAVAQGKRVHAVIGGHMHHRLKKGGRRKYWQVTRDGVLYINAARVLRIRRNEPGKPRHHIALTISEQGARAEALWINDAGERCAPPPGEAGEAASSL